MSSDTQAAAGPDQRVERRLPVSNRWRGLGVRYGTLLGFLLMIIVFSLARPGVFPSVSNARNIVEQAAPILLVSIGFTVVVATNEFDLSFIGSSLLAAVLAAKAVAEWHWPAGLAVLLALAAGAVLGLIGGLVVSTRRASSLITTLGLGTIWSGLALGLSKEGQSIIIESTSYLNLTFLRPLGIPLAVIYAAVVTVVAVVLLRSTVFGRSARAIGSNEEAARLAGIGLSGTRIWAFVFAGLCYGLAAVVLTSRAGQFSPDLTSGLLVPPFVAVFFGLSVLGAGRFNILGSVVGALFIGTLETGLTVLGTSAWATEVVTGTALVVILLLATRARAHR